MEKDYIEAYLTGLYFDNGSKKWKGFVTSFPPTIGEYYLIKIPVPSDLVKKIGEIEAKELKKVILNS